MSEELGIGKEKLEYLLYHFDESLRDCDATTAASEQDGYVVNPVAQPGDGRHRRGLARPALTSSPTPLTPKSC